MDVSLFEITSTSLHPSFIYFLASYQGQWLVICTVHVQMVEAENGAAATVCYVSDLSFGISSSLSALPSWSRDPPLSSDCLGVPSPNLTNML